VVYPSFKGNTKIDDHEGDEGGQSFGMKPLNPNKTNHFLDVDNDALNREAADRRADADIPDSAQPADADGRPCRAYHQ